MPYADRTQSIFEYITVVAGGQVYDGWESVQIEWTFNQPEVNALVTTTEIGPFSEAPIFDKWNFPPGTEIQIYAGSELAFWGAVYSYEPKADAESHSVALICKTQTWAWAISSVKSETGQYQDTTDEAFVLELLKASGQNIELKSITGQGPQLLSWYQIRQGATNFFSSADVLLRNQKILMAHRDGSLVIHDGLPFKMSGAVVQGENILRMSAKLKDTLFETVEVVGQHSLQNALNTGIAPFAVFAADKISPKTPGKFKKVMDQFATTNSMAAKRALWEYRRSAGEGIQATVVVPGWRDAAGALWMANQDVYVYAPWLQIECTLRTARIVMNQDLASGTTTELTLVDPRTVSAGYEQMTPYETACNNGPMWDVFSGPKFGGPR